MPTGFNPTSGYNRSQPIPGVSGRRVPGNARMPSLKAAGGFLTNVPRQQSARGQAGSAIFREFHRQQIRDVKGRFAGGWGFAWVGLEAFDNFLQNWNSKFHQDLHSAAESLKDEMVAYMKANAPWEDHPGENEDARENLQGAVVWNSEENFSIFLGHGSDVYYGIWLEVRWGGKYAIIVPTLQHFMPVVGERIRAMT